MAALASPSSVAPHCKGERHRLETVLLVVSINQLTKAKEAHEDERQKPVGPLSRVAASRTETSNLCNPRALTDAGGLAASFRDGLIWRQMLGKQDV